MDETREPWYEAMAPLWWAISLFFVAAAMRQCSEADAAQQAARLDKARRMQIEAAMTKEGN